MFPALAVASELIGLGVKVIWAGRRDSLEHSTAMEHGIEFVNVSSAGLVGRNILAKVRGASLIGQGVVQSLMLLNRLQPGAVLAAGSYVAAPLLAAASIQRRQFFLLEQNRIPGRVTRLFAGRAQMVFCGFPLERQLSARVCVSGNPLRRTLAHGIRSDDGRTVLVLGGSGGARVLSFAALDLAAALTNCHFIVVTGHRDYHAVRSRVTSRNVEVVEFTKQPELLYRRATIAISRAGGLVLSELLSFGIPAVLVPLPHAADGHQDANAQYLASIGAATVLNQNRLSGLTAVVKSLMDDERRRLTMQAAALAAARPDAAVTVANEVLQCLAA